MQWEHTRESNRRSSGRGRGRRRQSWRGLDCREVVSLLQAQASESQLLPEVLGERGPHLCLVSTIKSWPLQMAKIAERKAGSFCEKGRDVINQIPNLLAKTSRDSSDLKKWCLYNHSQHLGRERAGNSWSNYWICDSIARHLAYRMYWETQR